MKDLMGGKLFLKNNLIIAVTLAKIALKKPYLHFPKISTPVKHG